MLSDVMLPPQPPHPSVIDGSRPVVSPIDSVRRRRVDDDPVRRLLQAELQDDLLVAGMDGHGVPHPAVPQDLLAPLAALLQSATT
jgi:hypothetical protein